MFTNKQLKALILPLIIEQFLGVLVGTMDVIMVSQVGECATSGVSLVDTITNLLVQAFAALATGGSVIAANYIGKRRPQEASDAAGQLFVSTGVIGIVLMVICLVGRGFMIDKIYGSIDADVRESAMIYFLITCISYPFLAIYSAGAALCRAEGNSKVTMKVSVVVNIINVSGNALLILVLHMGTAGVAIPTLVSRMFGAAAMFYVMRKQDHPIHFHEKLHYRFNWPMIKKILRIGIPTGLDGSVFQIGKLVLGSLISTLGTAAIAANAVTNTLAGLVMIPGSAMGLSLITIVGQCIGAGKTDEAVSYTKKVMKWIHLCLLGMSLVIGLGSPLILRLYNLSDETFRLAQMLIIVYCIIAVIDWPESFALPNALRAGGDATFIMIVSMSSMWLFRIACAYLFVKVFNWGLNGIWIAMYVDWLVRAAAFFLRFRSRKWIRLLKN
ncbi:MAG: MATE family efflux transporter [Lachnospiraceae bacterium]|nr:MATE family efflux transporter [Lachnospiraceae bacterium]